MKKGIIWLIIAIIVIVGIVLYAGESKQPSGIVKIGVIAPLTGDAAAYGEDTEKVLSYRIGEINQEEGAKFELVFEDGKCTGTDSVSAFQKLVDIDGVDVIIGGVCSSETLSIAPLSTEQGILQVSFGSSNPDIEEQGPYVFTLSYSDQVIGETLAEQMKGFSKVAIITEQNDYNVGIKNVWEKKIAEYPNVEVVANEVFPKAANDFRSLLAKVRKADPEAILLNPNVGTTAENLLRQMAEIEDWNDYQIFTQFAYLADEVREPVGDFANGMKIIDAPDLTSPDFLAHKNKIEAEAGPISTLGNYYTASAIDTIDIIASLIREIGNDPVALQEALSTRHFKGYLGDIYFGGNNFKQGTIGGIYIVKDGKAVYQQ